MPLTLRGPYEGVHAASSTIPKLQKWDAVITVEVLLCSLRALLSTLVGHALFESCSQVPAFHDKEFMWKAYFGDKFAAMSTFAKNHNCEVQ